MGPLAVMAGSHKHQQLQETYCTMDTHTYLKDSPDFKFGRLAADFLGTR